MPPRAVWVWLAAALVLGGADLAHAVTVVAYKGFEFRALDGTAPTSTTTALIVDVMRDVARSRRGCDAWLQLSNRGSSS